MSSLAAILFSTVVAIFKALLSRKPKEPTPDEELAETFDAIDRGDDQTFRRRRRRHLQREQSRRMRNDEPPR